jgi:hypothetical protein
LNQILDFYTTPIFDDLNCGGRCHLNRYKRRTGYVPSSHPLINRFNNPQPESTHVLADSQENHKYFVYGLINDDKIGAANAGVFLDILEIISYHNTALKHMISKHNAGFVNYFSNKI